MEKEKDLCSDKKHKKKPAPVRKIIMLLCLLAVLFVLSFTIGRFPVPIDKTVKILAKEILKAVGLDGVFSIPVTWTAKMQSVALMIRLPRILLACLVGASLSVAGASYQGVFQNPMASPDILGASSGAAFGAALAILLGFSTKMITISAFVFSVITVLLVFIIAQVAPGMRVINLILAGVMISSLFSAGTSYIKLVADPNDQLPKITYWMMGSLAAAKMEEVYQMILPMILGVVPLCLLRWQINLLTLGDEEATALGVNTDVVRLIVILCSTLVTAASVSVSGIIGWVGLVIPHLCRKFVGGNYRYLLPASIVCGALFLLGVDNISRNLMEVEIPIGILTAFVGVPFFIHLLFKREGT